MGLRTAEARRPSMCRESGAPSRSGVVERALVDFRRSSQPGPRKTPPEYCWSDLYHVILACFDTLKTLKIIGRLASAPRSSDTAVSEVLTPLTI